MTDLLFEMESDFEDLLEYDDIFDVSDILSEDELVGLDEEVLVEDFDDFDLYEQFPNVPDDVMGTEGWTAEEESNLDDAGREIVKKKLAAPDEVIETMQYFLNKDF